MSDPEIEPFGVTTPTLALPYPVATDPADVPADMGRLANRIEALYGVPGGFASLGTDGKVPPAQLVSVGSPVLDYTAVTASVHVPKASNVDSNATPVVTGHSVTYPAARVRVELAVPYYNGDGNNYGNELVGLFYRDTTLLARVQLAGQASNGAFNFANLLAVVYDTPAAGAHTYSVTARNAHAGTDAVDWVVIAGGDGPGHISGVTTVIAPITLAVSLA